MAWRGEYETGNYSAVVTIPQAEFEHWKRRIRAGEAKPEAQLMSQWSERAARPADIATYYHNNIEMVRKLYPSK